MEGFENGGDMSGFRSLNNSTSKRVLDDMTYLNFILLIELSVREILCCVNLAC